MLISNLFVKHKVPQPRFAPGLFLALLAVFSLVGQYRPVVGLVGIGTTAIITSVLIELNRKRIWENYRKGYKKIKGLKGIWTEPNKVFYTLNVAFLWPFILFLGVICLWAAIVLA
jgi:hypothetical protein